MNYMKTYIPKPDQVTRQWVLVDARGQRLGRLASQVAAILRGKHRPDFTPHLDLGDGVVVINAAEVVLTGRKLEQKKLYRHSGYPGGLHAVSYSDLMATRPELVIKKAVRGMLPKNRLGRKMLKKLRVYAGSEHDQQAQQPQPLSLGS